MILVGAAGGTLFLLALAQKHGWNINEDMLVLGMEVAKYGAILWLMNKFWVVFL